MLRAHLDTSRHLVRSCDFPQFVRMEKELAKKPIFFQIKK